MVGAVFRDGGAGVAVVPFGLGIGCEVHRSICARRDGIRLWSVPSLSCFEEVDMVDADRVGSESAREQCVFDADIFGRLYAVDVGGWPWCSDCRTGGCKGLFEEAPEGVVSYVRMATAVFPRRRVR